MRALLIGAAVCGLLSGCTAHDKNETATKGAEIAGRQEGINYAAAAGEKARVADAPMLEEKTKIGSPSADLSVPEPIQGSWRESQGKVVTAAECLQTSGHEANFGKVLTVRPDGFSFFEAGGRLLEIKERSANRIRATFDTTYADTQTQGEYVFDAQDNGTMLIVREYGDHARPGPIRYLRCPA